MFKVVLKPRAEKEFNKLPRNLKQKFFEELQKLSISPFSQRIKKLRGTDFGYRFRVGRWRILFALFGQEKKIEIVDIFLKKGKSDYSRRLDLF